MNSPGCVYSWCGCRDQYSGRRMGARCPLRGAEGHGSWYLSLELPPALDGSRRRIRRGGFPRRPHAEMALARLRMPSPGGSPLTVGQWLEHWLVSRTAPRISTLRGYATHIRLYLAPCLGQILLADLTPAHVQAMFTAISRQHEAMGRPVTDLGSGTAFISWQLRHYDGHVVLCPPKTARASGSSRWTAPPSPPCLSTGHASSPSAPRPARTTSTAARCLPGPTGTPWLLTGSRVTFASSTRPAACRRSACTTSATAPPALLWLPEPT